MNKSQKATASRPAPLTEEQKQEQVIRFFSQKRESFAQAILFNLCNGLGFIPSEGEDTIELVERSVEMADLLIEKLYPIKAEE